MLRLVDITEHDSTHLSFETSEIEDQNIVAYVMYDTSTGSESILRDYYSWRCITTSTGEEDVFALEIDNTTKYPKVEDDIPDYSIFNRKLFKVMTWAEHELIQMLLTRIDLIRRRFPNPGVTISDTDNIGETGVVGFAGGWDKKFSLEELRQMIEGSLIEVNWHPPSTEFWWVFGDEEKDSMYNPYNRTSLTGVPYDLFDVIIQGAVIRCLCAWGILEIDLSFSTSDSGLTITYDRVGPISSWMQNLLTSFEKQKILAKMNYVNSAGIGVGSYPYAAMGIYGSMMNMIQSGGTVPLSSMLGFHLRSNVPL